MSEQIYEYLWVDLTGREAEGRTDVLNEYAAEGWELISYWAYFRRSAKLPYWTTTRTSWSCDEVSEEA